MRDQEFRARDKMVQKMARDGLTEKNLTKGTEERVSSREKDFSYKRAEETGGQTVPGAGRGDNTRYPSQERQRRQRGENQPQTSNQPAHGRQTSGQDHGNPMDGSGGRDRDNMGDRSGRGQGETESANSGRRQENRGNGDAREQENPESGGQAGHSHRETQWQESHRRGRPENESREGKQEKRRERGTTEDPGPGADGKADGSGEGKPNRQRKYEKARRRVEREGEKLERAREKLPKRRKLRYSTVPEGQGGKRLHFETEAIPEHEKKPLPKRMGRAAARAVSLAAEGKLHQKVREAEKQSVGVEAAHKTETVAEAGLRGAMRRGRERARTKPYRSLHRAERRMARAESRLAYETFLRENPEMQKRRLKKLLQKQRIKRQYAAAAKEAGKAGGSAAAKGAGKITKVLKELLPGKKTVMWAAGLGIVLMSLCGSLLSSCSAMFGGIQSTVIASCYTAEEGDICRSELYYTEMETDLRIDIENTENDYPGYDEYKYVTGPIGHDPYELMAYLSAVFGSFAYSQAEPELERLFGLQYELEREETTETRTYAYTDEEGEEQEEEYEWTVLTTTLTVTPLSDIIADNLTAGEQTDLYCVYMATHGGRQCYASPFDFDWLPYVTSRYGYRAHPVSGGKNLHRGIDIGAAEGTAIHAAQDGTVTSAGEAGGYGLCVVIDGTGGYQSKYAHCASVLVSAGQEVKRGDVIATVGSTGVSTGPHLHLEVLHNGEYLNPGYFVGSGVGP